jgi:hypothetical protein
VGYSLLAGQLMSSESAMWIALPDAVRMYARFCHARYGTVASKMAQEKAIELKQKGDLQGHQIWSDLAREIEHRTVTPPSSPAAQ